MVDVERFGNANPTSSSFWTTIGNFYDTNQRIIEEIVDERNEGELEDAKKIRLPEDRISFYQAGVVDFYVRLSAIEPLLAVALGPDRAAAGRALVAARTGADPRLLARPVGLKIITKLAAVLRTSHSMRGTFRQLRRVPMVMTRVPFANVIWDPSRSRMQVKGENLAARLCSYMLGLSTFDERLRQSYAEWFG